MPPSVQITNKLTSGLTQSWVDLTFHMDFECYKSLRSVETPWISMFHHFAQLSRRSGKVSIHNIRPS